MKNLPLAARLYIGSLLAAVAALAAAAAPRSLLVRGGYGIAALVVLSMYLAYRTYRLFLGRIEDEQRHVQQLSDLHLATIEALALAIDAKDEIGQRHIRQMQVYAAGVARAMGMSETEIQGVKTASLLHDIGKLAVPEHILSKPGPLTQEEFQKIRIHPQVAAEAEAEEELPKRFVRIDAPDVAPSAAGAVVEPAPHGSVFQDIALAHREIYALYEIAQAMGSSLGVADTMALISSKLSNIVPFSCCALFLYNDENETLRCRFATGVQAEQIQQLTIRNGHGLTGWVARNRRPLVNARPSADLQAAGVSGPTTLQ